MFNYSSGGGVYLFFYCFAIRLRVLCRKPRLLKCKVQVGFRNEYSTSRHSAREMCCKRLGLVVYLNRPHVVSLFLAT